MTMPDEQTASSLSNHLVPGTLWQKVRAQTDYALDCGALKSIPTHHEFVRQDGVSFLVRSLDNLARKEKAKQQKPTASGQKPNPFLPYEDDLFVTNLSNTHLCLLNKYNVVDHHLLIVTRAFEAQESWLNQHDFSALWSCMTEIDGLAFYNGGQIAGASQPHKHLQLVPMPLSPDQHPIPIESVIDGAFSADDAWQPSTSETHQSQKAVRQLNTLPFDHAIAPLNLEAPVSSSQASATLLKIYQMLLDTIGAERYSASDRQTIPYNLLMTRRWAMIVPRSQESYASISVNSLGFAGSLFVKDEDQLKILKQIGPMQVLQHVARSKTVQ